MRGGVSTRKDENATLPDYKTASGLQSDNKRGALGNVVLHYIKLLGLFLEYGRLWGNTSYINYETN